MTARPPLRVLVVDDEPLARRSVLRHLRAVRPDAAAREAADGFAALEAVRDQEPDLVFLDVEMPELSGFDVLRQLPPPRPKIVFATAYAHFAVRAFEENACDYLVKPFTLDRFRAALERALSQLDSDARLAALEKSLDASGERLTRLVLRTGDRLDVVPVDDVACFVSQGHLTYVHAGRREFITELSLQHLEQRLDPGAFLRVHRRALVRLSRIVRIHDRTPATVELDNGLVLPVSRRSRAALRGRIRGA